MPQTVLFTYGLSWYMWFTNTLVARIVFFTVLYIPGTHTSRWTSSTCTEPENLGGGGGGGAQTVCAVSTEFSKTSPTLKPLAPPYAPQACIWWFDNNSDPGLLLNFAFEAWLDSTGEVYSGVRDWVCFSSALPAGVKGCNPMKRVSKYLIPYILFGTTLTQSLSCFLTSGQDEVSHCLPNLEVQFRPGLLFQGDSQTPHWWCLALSENCLFILCMTLPVWVVSLMCLESDFVGLNPINTELPPLPFLTPIGPIRSTHLIMSRCLVLYLQATGTFLLWTLHVRALFLGHVFNFYFCYFPMPKSHSSHFKVHFSHVYDLPHDQKKQDKMNTMILDLSVVLTNRMLFLLLVRIMIILTQFQILIRIWYFLYAFFYLVSSSKFFFLFLIPISVPIISSSHSNHSHFCVIHI